jgi:YfiR/HmsC-like
MASARNQLRLHTIGWTARWLLALAMLPLCSPSDAADEVPEYGVKAAFLLNFTKFAEWPPSAFGEARAHIEICILGKDPFGRVLDDVVQGEIVRDRRLTVRRITQAPAPQTCQVLFLDPGLKDLPKILRAIPEGVLTVSEGDHFIRDGGMIAFVIDGRRVRFDINAMAADKAAVKLSSQLLNVARSVAK